MFLWPLSMGMPYLDPHAGMPAAGAQAYFYQGGTTTPKPVFHTDDGAAPHTWPVLADANGRFPPIFIPYGPYGFRVTNKSDVAIGPAIPLIANPKPPEEGGGPGIVVTQADILQTGDVLWNLRSGNCRANNRRSCQWQPVDTPDTKTAKNRPVQGRLWSSVAVCGRVFGGARRNRTADLLNAIQALSQLSYGPTHDDRLGDRSPTGFWHRLGGSVRATLRRRSAL
jgi:hypothetical protein